MPTGYTAPVQSGEITEFKDFALQCARAFGALIMMRDDPSDAPIPKRFEPSTYNADRLAEATAELARISDQPVSFWEAEASRTYAEALARWEERRQEKREQRTRYEAMLAKVEAWTPPTPDHEELKKFMGQQLAESIRFDCGSTDEDEAKYDPKPELRQWADYRAERLAELTRQVSYHTEENRKEIERTEGRNRWVEALRAAL